MARKPLLNKLMVSTTPLDPEILDFERRIKDVEYKIGFVSERVEVIKKLIEKNNILISRLVESNKMMAEG